MIYTTSLLNQICGQRVILLFISNSIIIGTRGRALDLLNAGTKKRK